MEGKDNILLFLSHPMFYQVGDPLGPLILARLFTKFMKITYETFIINNYTIEDKPQDMLQDLTIFLLSSKNL